MQPISVDAIYAAFVAVVFVQACQYELATKEIVAKFERPFDTFATDDTFGTNVFPFIKPGPMNAGIPQRLMDRAAIEYGLPQIEIVKPKLVTCFGKSTFNALRTAVGVPSVYDKL